MASKEPKIRKQATAGTTRHTTLTIPKTLNIIMKPVLQQARMSLWHHKVWTVDQLRYKENTRKKLHARNEVNRGAA